MNFPISFFKKFRIKTLKLDWEVVTKVQGRSWHIILSICYIFVSWSSKFLIQPLVESKNTESNHLLLRQINKIKQRFRDFETYCCGNVCLLAPAKLSTCSQLSQLTDSCCSAWQVKTSAATCGHFLRKVIFEKLSNLTFWFMPVST